MPETKKVFIVHGRDSKALQEVIETIKAEGFSPVLLEEEAKRGHSILQKFEELADEVIFAVILMTPDDLGKLNSNDESEKLRFRARQNVVFEAGYFFAWLGRDGVAIVKKGNIELPSDIQEILYIDMDHESWGIHLIQEIKNADMQNFLTIELIHDKCRIENFSYSENYRVGTPLYIYDLILKNLHGKRNLENCEVILSSCVEKNTGKILSNHHRLIKWNDYQTPRIPLYSDRPEHIPAVCIKPHQPEIAYIYRVKDGKDFLEELCIGPGVFQLDYIIRAGNLQTTIRLELKLGNNKDDFKVVQLF